MCWVWHGVFFLDVFTYVQHLHPALGLGYACLPLTRLFGIVISDSWDLQHVAQSQTISWMCASPQNLHNELWAIEFENKASVTKLLLGGTN